MLGSRQGRLGFRAFWGFRGFVGPWGLQGIYRVYRVQSLGENGLGYAWELKVVLSALPGLVRPLWAQRRRQSPDGSTNEASTGNNDCQKADDADNSGRECMRGSKRQRCCFLSPFLIFNAKSIAMFIFVHIIRIGCNIVAATSS